MLDASMYVSCLDHRYISTLPTPCSYILLLLGFPTENLPYPIRYTTFTIVQYPTGLQMYERPKRITHCRWSPRGIGKIKRVRPGANERCCGSPQKQSISLDSMKCNLKGQQYWMD